MSRVRVVFFDVGETIVDERGFWRQAARFAGVPEHVVWAALGLTIARGEDHRALWAHLGIERPEGLDSLAYAAADLYPDVRTCLEQLRDAGYRVGLAGNQSWPMEEWARGLGLPVDVIGSSASFGVSKPAPGFFERIVELAGVPAREIAYVGDRVDYDVLPARECGLVAVHLRRGPWGLLQQAPAGVPVLGSLAELPDRLASLA